MESEIRLLGKDWSEVCNSFFESITTSVVVEEIQIPETRIGPFPWPMRSVSVCLLLCRSRRMPVSLPLWVLVGGISGPEERFPHLSGCDEGPELHLVPKGLELYLYLSKSYS